MCLEAADHLSFCNFLTFAFVDCTFFIIYISGHFGQFPILDFGLVHFAQNENAAL